MSHRLHLGLMFAGEFAGFIAGAIAAIAIFMTRPFEWPFIATVALMGGLVLVGVMLPRTLFRRIVPARCPAAGCGGRAFPEGTKPIVYRCRRCGHLHDTGWEESSTRPRP